MNDESFSSSGSRSRIFSRTWVASLLVLSLEVDGLSSIDLDSSILGLLLMEIRLKGEKNLEKTKNERMKRLI